MKLKITYDTSIGIVIYNTSTDDIYDIANIMIDEMPVDIDCVKKIGILVEMEDDKNEIKK